MTLGGAGYSSDYLTDRWKLDFDLDIAKDRRGTSENSWTANINLTCRYLNFQSLPCVRPRPSVDLFPLIHP